MTSHEGPVPLSVGSTNRMKVAAVKEVVSTYTVLSQAEITSTDVPSGVSDQPTSLEETVLGAKTRAERAYLGSGYAIGIESGLMEIKGTGGVFDLFRTAPGDESFAHVSEVSAQDNKLTYTAPAASVSTFFEKT